MTNNDSRPANEVNHSDEDDMRCECPSRSGIHYLRCNSPHGADEVACDDCLLPIAFLHTRNPKGH